MSDRSLTSIDRLAMAQSLLATRDAGATLDVTLTDEYDLSLDLAYDVQREVTLLRLARGERIVGWKLGYTSIAMRVQMGVEAPNMGPLTDAMLLSEPASDGVAELPGSALQPRVEPEIAMRLAAPLEPGCTPAEVLAACEGAYACLEVVDSLWTGYRFRLEDNTADGSSAGWVVLGGALPLADLPTERVTRLVNGFEVAAASGAAAGGDPAIGVAWVAGETVRRYGRRLEAGDVVISGGLTAAHALTPGGTIEARFGSGIRVSVSRPA